MSIKDRYEKLVKAAVAGEAGQAEPSKDEVRKVLQALASRGGKKRWEGVSKEERAAYARKMLNARWRRRRRAKAVRSKRRQQREKSNAGNEGGSSS
jgi:hypothetical protein